MHKKTRSNYWVWGLGVIVCLMIIPIHRFTQYIFFLTQESKRILIITMNGSGGHIATAKSLSNNLNHKYEIDMVPIDFATSSIYDDFIMPHPIVRACYNLVACLQWEMSATLYHLFSKKLNRILSFSRYECVICVTPWLIPTIIKLLDHLKLNTPLIIIPTDLHDPLTLYSKIPIGSYWFYPGSSRATYLLGSDRLMQQAESLGIKSVVPISGMVIDKKFTTKTTPKSLIRKDLGIPSDAKVVLFLFGSCASLEMVDLAKIMQQHPDYYCVFICGKSASVKAKIELLDKDKKYRVLGFVNNVDQWMQAADVCVGKPGPGIISECTSSFLPIVVKGGFDVMLQEKYNVEYITSKQIGKVLKDWNELPQAVTDIISNKEKYAEVFAAIPKNNALEEACDYIESVSK